MITPPAVVVAAPLDTATDAAPFLASFFESAFAWPPAKALFTEDVSLVSDLVFDLG